MMIDYSNYVPTLAKNCLFLFHNFNVKFIQPWTQGAFKNEYRLFSPVDENHKSLIGRRNYVITGRMKVIEYFSWIPI